MPRHFVLLHQLRLMASNLASSTATGSRILPLVASWPRSRFWHLCADVYPALAAAALPWSTTAVAIFIVLWLVVLLPTLNFREFYRQFKRPAYFLPLALFAVAVLGTLWADDTWAVRLQALSPVAKLAAIPFLLYQFERSRRGHWVFIAFLASCSILMALSWIIFLAPHWQIAGIDNTPGVPVRNYIDQTHEFVLCAFGTAALLVTYSMKRKLAPAAGCLVLLLGFLFNMGIVVVSKSAFLYLPVLAVIFAETFLNRKLALSFYAAVVLALAFVWFSSPFLRDRADRIRFEENLNAGAKNALGNSLDQRLQYWRASWESIQTAPLFGTGTGSTTRLLQDRNKVKSIIPDEKVRNPHNQLLYVAVQWGLFGSLILLLMWCSHLFLFWRTASMMGWLGLIIVTQNIISSAVNSHLFDFHAGWIYVLGVGVAGGTIRATKNREDSL